MAYAFSRFFFLLFLAVFLLGCVSSPASAPTPTTQPTNALTPSPTAIPSVVAASSPNADVEKCQGALSKLSICHTSQGNWNSLGEPKPYPKECAAIDYNGSASCFDADLWDCKCGQVPSSGGSGSASVIPPVVSAEPLECSPRFVKLVDDYDAPLALREVPSIPALKENAIAAGFSVLDEQSSPRTFIQLYKELSSKEQYWLAVEYAYPPEYSQVLIKFYFRGDCDFSGDYLRRKMKTLLGAVGLSSGWVTTAEMHEDTLGMGPE